MSTRPSTVTLPFFALTLVITWGLQLPALLAKTGALAGPPEKFMALVGLGGLGPMLAATLLSYFEGRGAGVRALYSGLTNFRFGAAWYLLALLLPGAIFAASMAVRALLGFGDDSRWFYPPSGAARVVALVVFSVGEEVGFRGFALPRLQRKFGPVAASLLLGAFWGAWHIPMMLLVGLSPLESFALIPFFVAGSVVFTWLFNHAQQSTLVAVLAHAGAHLNNPQQALPNLAPTLIHSLGYAAVAILLLCFDRQLGNRTNQP